MFASNTSTLPITGLAKASARPKNFIGLHFFSPGGQDAAGGDHRRQGDAATTRWRSGFDYVLQIGKTPIVVNDSRGFYTSRVFGTYVTEGIAMLKEGVHPRSIEVAGLQAGMPMPPLALQDEVSLVSEPARAGADAQRPGRRRQSVARAPGLERGAPDVRDRPHRQEGRQGLLRLAVPTAKQLWPELTKMYPPSAEQPEQRELIDRLMFAQANEAARCYEENVLRSVADGNIGSIFGWGFAPFQGGALQFINAMGPEEVRGAGARAGEEVRGAVRAGGGGGEDGGGREGFLRLVESN